MDYSNIIAITNRKICFNELKNHPVSDWYKNTYLTKELLDTMTLKITATEQPYCMALLTQLAALAKAGISHIVLREKDMPVNDYTQLAKAAIEICSHYNSTLILHSYIEAAQKLKHPHIHLPINLLPDTSLMSEIKTLGVSVHSVDDTILAEKYGATYVTAGHIFDTNCKKGLPGRGLSFLKTICNSVSIPVYAIGGINEDNLPLVMECGAKGGCMMSGLMNYSYHL